MLLSFLNKHRETGLLILRIGIGIMFIFHGAPKVFGGVERWERLGAAMGSIGIEFMPVFWGLMAGLAEFLGGISLILGLFFRPACIFLTITMLVATSSHLDKGDSVLRASHAIESGFLFLSLIFIGPGKYSLDEKINTYQKQKSQTYKESKIQELKV